MVRVQKKSPPRRLKKCSKREWIHGCGRALTSSESNTPPTPSIKSARTQNPEFASSKRPNPSVGYPQLTNPHREPVRSDTSATPKASPCSHPKSSRILRNTIVGTSLARSIHDIHAQRVMNGKQYTVSRLTPATLALKVTCKPGAWRKLGNTVVAAYLFVVRPGCISFTVDYHPLPSGIGSGRADHQVWLRHHRLTHVAWVQFDSTRGGTQLDKAIHYMRSFGRLHARFGSSSRSGKSGNDGVNWKKILPWSWSVKESENGYSDGIEYRRVEKSEWLNILR